MFVIVMRAVGTPVSHEWGDGLGSVMATAGKRTTAAWRKAMMAVLIPLGWPCVEPFEYAVTLCRSVSIVEYAMASQNGLQ